MTTDHQMAAMYATQQEVIAALAASSGNDWVTFDWVAGHYTARWLMQR
jgi:hypothetical protein